jgi:hypothetical protein
MAATDAHAADRGFCRQYSKAALNRVRGSLANARCAVGRQSSCRSSDFSVHYQWWCLGVSYAEAAAERSQDQLSPQLPVM